MEKVEFKTEDGVKIVGDWYPAAGDRFALLLHMMPVTRKKWKKFAEILVGEGISCLAIDERGHGESINTESGEVLHYDKIEDHSVKELDVAASLEWLKEKGMTFGKLAVIGASVGANLAIRTLAKHSEIRVGVALSPRHDARGVKTEDVMPKLAGEQKVLLVTSEEGDPKSFAAVNDLHELNRDHSWRIIAPGDIGHGQAMLAKDPEFQNQIAKWVIETL